MSMRLELMLDMIRDVWMYSEDEVLPPESSLQPGDHVLGVVGDLELQKLWSAMNAAALAAEYLGAHPEKIPCGAQFNSLFVQQSTLFREIAEFLKRLFWQAVIEGLGDHLEAGTELELKEGWQVVAKMPIIELLEPLSPELVGEYGPH